MKALILFVAVFAALSFGQASGNWNGWGDTAYVAGFTGTGTVYSPLFKLSSMENACFDVYAKDSGSAAGITNDSLQFVWGIQFVHPSYQSGAGTTVKYKYSRRLIIDTLDMWGTNVFIDTLLNLDNTGTYPFLQKTIDTSFSGWAMQSRQFSPQWDVSFRFWATGLAMNKKATYIPLVFQQIRRLNQK